MYIQLAYESSVLNLKCLMVDKNTFSTSIYESSVLNLKCLIVDMNTFSTS